MDKHVLILDSDLDDLRKIRGLFAREGYNIMTATDKKTALQILRKIPVNLVIGNPRLLISTDQMTED